MKILAHGLIAAAAMVVAIAPANANPVQGIMSGAQASGCTMTQRQAETVYMQLQLLDIQVLPILYLGTRNTPEGFRTVLDRLAARSTVAVVECFNIFEGFSLYYVAPDAKRIGMVQSDGSNEVIWIYLVQR